MVESFRYRNRLVGSIILLIIMVLFVCLAPFLRQQDKAYAASVSGEIVIDADTCEVIAGKNENVRLAMASTTKIMTALIVLERCDDIDKVIDVPKEAVGIEGSSIYLKIGQKYSIRDLLYGLMLRSGNDASIALSVAVCGSTEAFVKVMNEKAQDMGLKDTHFCNPNGLHDDAHYTTCYELAQITAEAMKKPTFREIVKTKAIDVFDGEKTQTLYNKNKFLTKYNGGCGVKTGYTKKSGRCLVAAAERDGKTAIAVALNQYDTYGVCSRLIDSAFAQFAEKN